MLALNDDKSIAVLDFDIFDPKARVQSFFLLGLWVFTLLDESATWQAEYLVHVN